MQPTQILFGLFGAPVPEAVSADGLCWLCAGDCLRGMRVEDWAGASFTGQNRVRNPTGTHVCEACVWICSRVSPVPGRPAKDGKKFGGNFRNYSHLWEDEWAAPAFGDGTVIPGYMNASKGEKSVIRDFLSRDHGWPWFAAIADSGQKHVLPWTPLNGASRGGTVLFDEQLVDVPRNLELMHRVTALLTAGATKEEVNSGDYSARAWQLCGDSLAQFESNFGPERGGGWFALAVWLAQRDEETTQRRMTAEKAAKATKKETENAERRKQRKTSNADSGGSARRASGVPGDTAGKRAKTLGPSSDADAKRVQNVGDSGGVVNVSGAKASDRNAGGGQLSLFD